jgi:hypothetical protein
VAEEVLGPERVLVRWADWLAEGTDPADLPPARREALLAEWAARGRDRLAGRAAGRLPARLELHPPAAFADTPCRDAILRSRHVHVDAGGLLCPGTCAGLVLGRASDAASIGRLWAELDEAFGRERPPADGPFELVALLAEAGPVALMRRARAEGYPPRTEGYAGKCHLCWHVRRWLFDRSLAGDRLGPAEVYRP